MVLVRNEEKFWLLDDDAPGKIEQAGRYIARFRYSSSCSQWLELPGIDVQANEDCDCRKKNKLDKGSIMDKSLTCWWLYP